VFAYQRKKVSLALALTDIALVSLAFWLAYLTRISVSFKAGFERIFFIEPNRRFTLILVTVASWLVIAAYSNLYEHLDSAQWTRIVRSTFRQCILATLSVVIFEYLVRWDLSRSFLLFLFLYAFVVLSIFRINSKKIIRLVLREFGAPYHIVIVGPERPAKELGHQIVQGSAFRISIVDILDDLECKERLPLLLETRVIDEVIFRVNSDRLSHLEEIFLLCDEEGVRTRVATDFFPHVNSRMTLDRFGTAPLLTFSAAPDNDLRLMIKRAFDIVVAAVGLIVLSPLFVIIAVLIKMTSKGPIIFKQGRSGLNGRHFNFYKFRSMVANAEQLKAELEHLNQKTTAFKIAGDPRLTAVGKWLRKFSLDEFPQLFNVLRGDMSIVGPRPALPAEIEHYHRWQRRRLRMRPGLTCLWAIRGRDFLDFDSWMKMDMEYIDGWSLMLDWKIIAKSIPYVLSGRGAH